MQFIEAPAAGKNLNFPDRPPCDEAALAASIYRKLVFEIGKSERHAERRDWFLATSLAVRDQLVVPWLEGRRQAAETKQKRVYFLSLEFLIGRLLRDSVSNMLLIPAVQGAMNRLGVDFNDLRQAEPDAALGNGGLGRLAACFMESMSSQGIPAFGFGIRYDHGLFRQQIRNGWQQEAPEEWLTFGNPWEFARPEIAYNIGFGGHVDFENIDGRSRQVWHPSEVVRAVAYDTPIVGWRVTCSPEMFPNFGRVCFSRGRTNET